MLGVGGSAEPLWESPKPRWWPAEFGWVVGCSYRGQPTATAPVLSALLDTPMATDRSLSASTEPDAAKRTELYQEANRVIMEFLPAVPISHSPNALVVAENVSGLVPSPLSAEDFSTVSISG